MLREVDFANETLSCLNIQVYHRLYVTFPQDRNQLPVWKACVKGLFVTMDMSKHGTLKRVFVF